MIAWFLGTKIGRGIAFGVAFVGLLVVVYWRIFTAGKNAERAKQAQQSIRNYQTREAVHEDVVSRPDDQRRSDLGRWVRPD